MIRSFIGQRVDPRPAMADRPDRGSLCSDQSLSRPVAPVAVRTAAVGAEWISIQYLRAVAAGLVVVFHLGTQAARLGDTGPWIVWPARGVDIFFVISGTLMWLTTAGRDPSPSAFLRRRAIRIVPLYYLLTGATVLSLAAAPGMVRSGALNGAHVLASYLFLPYRHPVLGTAAPVLIPGWTLNYEVYFYVLFGLTLAIPERWRLCAALVLLSIPVMIRSVAEGGTASEFYGSSIVFEFGFGLVLGIAIAQARWPSATTGGGLIVAGVLALVAWAPPDLPRVLTSGLPALAIVAGAVTLEHHGRMPRIRSLRTMGDASYALYLSHGMVLSATGQALRLLGVGGHAWTLPVLVVAGVASSQAVAILIHNLVERPLVATLSRRA